MNFKSSIVTSLFIIACLFVFISASSAQSRTESNKLRDFTYDYSNSTWTISFNGVPITIEQSSENEDLLNTFKTLLDSTKKEVVLFQVAFATILLAHLLLSFLYILKPNWLTAPVTLGAIGIIFIAAFIIYSSWGQIYNAFNDLRYYYYALIR